MQGRQHFVDTIRVDFYRVNVETFHILPIHNLLVVNGRNCYEIFMRMTT